MSASTGEHPLSFPLTVLQRVYYPELALPALSKTRVLILGAGTLGASASSPFTIAPARKRAR